MTPVILDHGRFGVRLPAFAADRLHADRGTGQAALVTVLGLAFVAMLLARPSTDAGGSSSPNSGVAASPAPTAGVPTDAAAASPSARPAPSESAQPTSPPPTTSVASPSPGLASPTTAASAGPSTSGATYRVKSGDTLSAIARRFGTTTRVLVELNNIADPSKLKIGQVLKLP